MKLERIPWNGSAPPSQGDLRRTLEADGFSVFAWTDAPEAHYDAHHHDHDESIWCVDGEITFGAGGGTLRLGPGDRLMLPKGTTHTADAGPAGATYLIGQRDD
jgi:quercetin dioxygenase-like cupin family protein